LSQGFWEHQMPFLSSGVLDSFTASTERGHAHHVTS
jgi:hypothetical protein